jgi:hypothetical protein
LSTATFSTTRKKLQPRRQSGNISPVAFCVAWESSETVQEAAEKCSVLAGKPVSKSNVSSRASLYRGTGITLKLMRREAATCG